MNALAQERTNNSYSYTAFGLGIESEMPIPELIEASGAIEVTISLGFVDREPPPDALIGQNFWATANECCVFEDRVGTFRVTGGSEITVHPAAGVGRRMLSTVLMGPVFSALLYQRGKLMLHGSAVAIDGGVVAFFGGPGWGKSTTAAAFHAAGHDVVTDDEIVTESRDGRIMVLPAYPQFRLWPDAAAAVGRDPERLPRLHEEFEKRVGRVTEGFTREVLPLRRAYVLAQAPVLRIEPLSQKDAVVELVRHSLGSKLLTLGGGDRHFLQCAEIVRTVPVSRLERPRSLDGLKDLVKLVEEDVAA